MRSIIGDYKQYLEDLNYSKTTMELYSSNVLEFEKFLKRYNGLRLTEATRTEVLQYLYFINEKNNKSRTRRHKLFALKNFYKWLKKIHPMINPTYGIDSMKIAPSLPKYLNLEQAQELQNIYNEENSRNSFKYNLIISLFLQTGLRISEVCSIKLDDIDMLNCVLKVKCKGNYQRSVYFTTELQKLIKTYSREYEPLIFLFESKKGKQYSRRGMHQIIANAFKIAGIEGMSAHSLRHTTATIMYENTKNILLVKEFLGHKSIESTMIYTHVSNDDIRNAVNSNPLNRRYRWGKV